MTTLRQLRRSRKRVQPRPPRCDEQGGDWLLFACAGLILWLVWAILVGA